MAAEFTEVTIQDVYSALVDDASRNQTIANDIVSMWAACSPR
jgi:hypothetical protein